MAYRKVKLPLLVCFQFYSSTLFYIVLKCFFKLLRILPPSPKRKLKANSMGYLMLGNRIILDRWFSAFDGVWPLLKTLNSSDPLRGCKIFSPNDKSTEDQKIKVLITI